MLSKPPNASGSINDSTSLDLRIEWVKLMMPEWNHLVGFQVIADEGSLTHNCTLTAGGQGFDIKHKNHFRLSNDSRGGRRRSEENTSELQSLMRISHAVYCLKNKSN